MVAALRGQMVIAVTAVIVVADAAAAAAFATGFVDELSNQRTQRTTINNEKHKLLAGSTSLQQLVTIRTSDERNFTLPHCCCRSVVSRFRLSNIRCFSALVPWLGESLGGSLDRSGGGSR